MGKNSDFNLSAEVRKLVAANNAITGPEALAALEKKFKGQKINKGSCGVAFAMARKKMGLTRQAKPTKIGKPISNRIPTTGADLVSLGALKAARQLLSETNGDVETAKAILQEIRAMQTA